MTDVPAGHIKVRTTMRPQDELVVTEAEATDLARQGVLKTDNAEIRKLTGTEGVK
jgi:archaeosine-15-forming tRNA-guanine transglycosylase